MPTALVRRGDRPLLHLALLALTVCTTFVTFLFVLEPGAENARFWGRALGRPGVDSFAFALALVCILGAHEMGHYLLARYHQVDTSLPYFIPIPFIGVGTLGAVIRIRGKIPDRNALVDIGAAGPLAGLAVAIPVMVVGLLRSRWVPAPDLSVSFPTEMSLWNLLHVLGVWIASKLHLGPALASGPESEHVVLVYGNSLLKLGLQYLVRGPAPAGKMLAPDPLVVAAWFGVLVTMLNLIPVGQLDGGHLTHAVFGRHAQAIGKIAAIGLLLMCLFVSAGWLLWLLVTTLAVGFRHPPVLAPEVPLSPRRKWICALCLLALFVCVMPLPIRQVAFP